MCTFPLTKRVCRVSTCIEADTAIEADEQLDVSHYHLSVMAVHNSSNTEGL